MTTTKERTAPVHEAAPTAASTSVSYADMRAVSIMAYDAAAVKATVNSTHTPAPVTEKKPTKRETERAARVAEARVEQIGPVAWQLESATTPGTFHEVHATPGGLVCTCPAHGRCWHLDRVAPLYAAQQRRQARYDNAWLDEFRAPTLLGAERLAAERLAAGYPDEPVWGAS